MQGNVGFNPADDIPDLSGRVILITGGTAGLGRATVVLLAAHHPAHIFFTGRAQGRADEVVNVAQLKAPTTSVTFLPMDLGSFASIHSAAQQLMSRTSRLDLLFCNAGIMAVPADTTSDGYEIQFGTNHLGHALLIHQLLPTLLNTASKPNSDVRIISNTSTGFNNPPTGGIEFDRLKSSQDLGLGGRWLRYGQSKLANILYMSEMARRYPEILSVTIHPGVIKTDLVSSLSVVDQALVAATALGKMITLEDGVKNQLYTAVRSRKDVINGEFYEPVGAPGHHSALSKDTDLAARLWEWTEEEIKQYLYRIGK